MIIGLLTYTFINFPCDLAYMNIAKVNTRVVCQNFTHHVLRVMVCFVLHTKQGVLSTLLLVCGISDLQ